MDAKAIKEAARSMSPEDLDSLLDKLPSNVADAVVQVIHTRVPRHRSSSLNGKCVTRKVTPEEMEKLWK